MIVAWRPAAMSVTAFENLPYMPIRLAANFVATLSISRGERIEATLVAKSTLSSVISMNSVWQASMPAIARLGPSISDDGPVILASTVTVRAVSLASA